METRQLAIFISVARTLNFTRAADEHHMTQPAISHQITALEQELDAQLFIRTSHSVKLTSAGEEFLVHAKDILSRQRQAGTCVYDVSHGKTGRLDILTVHGAVNTCIRVVSAFSRKHPEVKIHLDIVNGADQMNAISSSGADLFFSVEDLLRSFPRLEVLKLEENPYHLVLNDSDFPEFQNTDDLSILGLIPLICEDDSHAPFLTGKVLEICRVRGLMPKNINWCTSSISQMMAVHCGLGFAILPSIPEDYMQNGLRFLPITGNDAVNDSSVGWIKDTGNQAVYYFLEVLQELYKDRTFLNTNPASPA